MTDDGALFEQVKLFLPSYLSPARQEDLWNELRSFPNNRTIYSDRNRNPEPLQGDAWRGFIAIDFETLERKNVSGVVLSNSCDISQSNRRALTPNINFIPLIRLARYAELLSRTGRTPQQIASLTESIRRQEVTSVMHLPEIREVMEESIALFDDMRGQPLDRFTATDRSLVFRLSDFGFYLFLFKLSIHFTRMLEDVER